MQKLKVVIISERKKERDVRDVRLWTIIIGVGTIFLFAMMIPIFTRNFPAEIDFLGRPMNFHYFIFGLFVLFFGIITGFFILKLSKAKKKKRKRGSAKYY